MSTLSIQLLLNISLLVLIATLITRMESIKKIIYRDNGNKFYNKLMLAVIFGLFGILSTYIGIVVNDAILNTRVIGVIAGSMLGGPVAGIGAGIIAGVHRYFFGLGEFASKACGISTVVSALIASVFYIFLKKRGRQYKTYHLFLLTAFSECVQMGIILLLARPFDQALALVRVIALPMIMLNAVGMVIFFGVFRATIVTEDQLAASRIAMALNIADQCFPHFNGISQKQLDFDNILSVVMKNYSCTGVAITNNKEFLSYSPALHFLDSEGERPPIPDFIHKGIRAHECTVVEFVEQGNCFFELLKKNNAILAPIMQKNEIFGCFILFVPKKMISLRAEIDFTKGFTKLISSQIALSELNYQKKLRHKAEFMALQSQINPHFLFNSLNTISCFCREKPEKARELLQMLSTYFRHNMGAKGYLVDIYEEIHHIDAYLHLEKARFEDALSTEILVEDDIICTLPSLILQPIVENAVRHGARTNKNGLVRISVAKSPHGTEISVADNGRGMPAHVLENLAQDISIPPSIGLINVHRRLKSIYGEEHGLQVHSSEHGTEVIITIPQQAKEDYDEDSDS